MWTKRIMTRNDMNTLDMKKETKHARNGEKITNFNNNKTC